MSNFLNMGKLTPVVFGEIKMSFWVQKRSARIFGKAKAARKFRS